MGGAGQLIVYGSGALDLQALLGDWLGETQFKKLIIIAVMTLLASVSITSWAVTERVRISDGYGQAFVAVTLQLLTVYD